MYSFYKEKLRNYFVTGLKHAQVYRLSNSTYSINSNNLLEIFQKEKEK